MAFFSKKRFDLESLSERIVPAVSGISFMNGNLSVRLDSQGGSLTLQGNNNNFRVLFNGTAVGNLAGYNLGGSLSVLGGNGNDTVLLEEQAAATSFRIPGAFSVNLGNGTDSLKTTGTLNVGGLANINMGNGTDTVTFADTAADSTTIANYMTVIMGQGNDTFNAIGGNLTVNGYSTISGANSVQLTGNAITLSSVSIQNAMAETNNNVLNLGDTTTLNGNLVYTSNTRTETIGFDGSTILGNVSLNLGQGASNVTLGNTTDTFVQGTFTVLGGNAADQFTIAATSASTINGSLNLLLANGDNTVTLDGDGTSTVGGSVTITTGSGNDAINVGSAGNTFTIEGALSMSVGNTSSATGNVVTLTSADIGANVSFNSGSGADTLTLESTQISGNLYANTGGGADTVEFDPSSATPVGTTNMGAAYINFGVGSGPDVFINNSGNDFDIFVQGFIG